ncbi:MAG: NADH-quinone oxidoreductase subunit C [Myxococcales bacterium]|nr:NADH-quinone oxidoreductase subunit C [Myxococcales bacterium]
MSSVLARAIPVGEIEVLAIDAWRAQLLARAQARARPVIVYGRRDAARVVLTAVHQDGAGLVAARTSVDPATGYHELTSSLPALHCFERELHEQLGVRVAGHPWLKPVRFEGRDQAAMGSYPFYRVDGKEVHEVAVGPIHAGVIEPGSFRFMCFGEHVLHLEIHLGYQHRGVEARLLQRDPRALAPWAETIAGDTTIGHAWAYAAALEALAGHEVAPEHELARAVMLELERVAMHLAGLAGLAADVGFLPGAATYGRLRTTAINSSMRLCGSRFGRGAVRPCGSGVTLDDELRELLRANVQLLRRDGAIIDDSFEHARSVRHRLAGVGVVSADLAMQLGLVGMAARSAGVAIDTRMPAHGLYEHHPIALCTETGGDCWARAQLRISEIRASLDWLDRVLAERPTWRPARDPVPALAPSRLAIAVVEGWRGEVVHCLETGEDGALVHYKAQDPSLRNWMGLALAVRGNDISDFPICNKSFDLSYCGNDL